MSNWYLEFFDKKVIDSWNPTYYGRYVDDIIIVDKVDKKSEIYSIVRNIDSDVEEEVIEHFFCDRPDNTDYLLERKVKDTNTNIFHCSNCQLYEGITYKVCNVWDYKSDKEPDVQIQNKKVQVFFFDHKGSDALITCFRDNIAQNASEFRMLPQDDAIQHGDYSSIYNIAYEDTINKLSGVKQINIDKFNLAKFLGKNLQINTLIHEEKLESRFVSDLGKIFGHHALIQNYRQWEQILHILIIEEQLDTLKDFCGNLMRAIDAIVVHYITPVKNIIDIKDTLKHVFASALYRAIAVNWRINIEDISNILLRDINLAVKKCFSYNLGDKHLESSQNYRVGYCKTRMINKYYVPGLIDSLLESSKYHVEKGFKSNINLSDINKVIELYPKNFNKYQQTVNSYKYYPYIIKPQEIAFDLQIRRIVSSKTSRNKLRKDVCDIIKDSYKKFNFPSDDNLNNSNDKWMEEIQSDCLPFKFRYPKIERNTLRAVKIGNKRKVEFKIALANANVVDDNLLKVLTQKPGRSFERYNQVADIVNQALKSDADILLMPEAYVPFEWLPSLANVSAKNQMSIITGVEHILYLDKVFNLTAVILPYERKKEYRFAHVEFHEKVHFAPKERKRILGYGKEPVPGVCCKLALPGIAV